jgi:hypothetical protein
MARRAVLNATALVYVDSAYSHPAAELMVNPTTAPKGNVAFSFQSISQRLCRSHTELTVPEILREGNLSEDYGEMELILGLVTNPAAVRSPNERCSLIARRRTCLWEGTRNMCPGIRQRLSYERGPGMVYSNWPKVSVLRLWLQ